MAISKRVRFEVLRRDNNTCRYCHATDTPLTIDHVIPVALGGTDDPSNLCVACKDCNAGKTSTSPDADTVAAVEADALRWAVAMEKAATAAAKRAQEIHEYITAFDEAWTAWGFGPDRAPVSRPGDWEGSVRHWQAAGLPVPLLVDSVRIAMTNDKVDAANTWRYFCGVAWSKVRKLQDEAQAML